MEMDKPKEEKYLDLISKMQNNSLCKANMENYLIYNKDWLYKHLEEEFELQKEVKKMKIRKENKNDR